MPVLPGGKAARITFCRGHVDAWTTNAVAMGSTDADVASWSSLVDAADAAQTAQTAAKAAAVAATQAYDDAVKAMTYATADIIKQIKTKAAKSGDSIYTLAQIPAPADPGPTPDPGTPYNFKSTLDGSGALTIKWKCDNPAGSQGTIYQIYRSFNGSPDVSYVGGAGGKVFVDNTIPAGTTQVMYQIQAVRSTAVGPWATFNVFFGSNTGSTTPTTTVTTSDAPAPKLAA